jgi:predicted RNase H-like nuclease (RuvC/YqgF family)
MVKDLQEQNKNLEAQINQKDQEIDELKKQLNDFDSNEKLKEESKEKNKENIEQIDTSLFINRDNLAKAISDSRVGSGFPT